MGRPATSYVGRVFGAVTVVADLDRRSSSGSRLRLVKCSCGAEMEMQTTSLYGQTTHCHCLTWGNKSIALVNYKHGRAATKEYRAWWDMLCAARLPRVRRYKYVGAKGIRVCDRWLDFQNFLNDMGLKPEGFNLTRKDRRGDFAPDNCVWADKRGAVQFLPHDKGSVEIEAYHEIFNINAVDRVPNIPPKTAATNP